MEGGSGAASARVVAALRVLTLANHSQVFFSCAVGSLSKFAPKLSNLRRSPGRRGHPPATTAKC